MLLLNDYDQWNEFGKKILEEKMHSSEKLLHEDRSNDDKDHLPKPCDQIKWNVLNENSNILILKMEMESNRSICSLTNANSASAYFHLCQYGEG